MPSLSTRIIRGAMKTGALLPFWVGFMLLVLPITARLDLQYALPSLKLISVLGGILPTVVLGVLLVVLGVFLRGRVIAALQAENDRTAQRIMATLLNDPAAPVPDFYLYLRAFETTGRLSVPRYLRLRKFSIGLFQLVTSDLESYVSSALRSTVPLIAMGRPGETVGAGRIAATEQDWEGDVSTLMERAKGVLLVPSHRPGTLWEVDALKRSGRLGKVVFIMPPRTHGTLDTRERWEVARQTLVSHGIDAPEYQERGLLFETDSNGKVSNVEPLLLNSARQVRKSLRRLLSDAPPQGGLYQSIAKAHKRARGATIRGWLETIRELSPIPLALGALLLGLPNRGFDPRESWGTVWDRSITAGTLAGFGVADLHGGIPPGVIRLDDALLRAYFTAHGTMLARVDPRTCAAISRAELDPRAMEIALSYIPSNQAQSFLDAFLTAEAAEQQQSAIPPVDTQAVEGTNEAFLSSLDDADQERYYRLVQAGDSLRDDEAQCWLSRVVFGRVGTLPEPYATVWARAVAAAIMGRDSTGSRVP